MFSINQVGFISNVTKQKCIEERMRFKKYYEEIEKYVSEFYNDENYINRIVVSDTIGINMLLEKPRDLNDFVYHLYSENGFKHANELTNILARISENSLSSNHPIIVCLRTTLPYILYNIMVDGRVMVIFYNLKKIETGSVWPILSPILTKTFDNIPTYVVAPEIQLIDLYRNLYLPKPDLWEQGIKDENRLIGLINQENIISTSGGDNEINVDKIKLHDIIIRKLLTNNKNIVIIGEHAIFLTNKNKINNSILQIIIDLSFDQFYAMLEKLFPPAKLSYKITNLYIMKDIRLKRMNIRYDGKEILYVYNCGQYDLIPFNKFTYEDKFLHIGNPFVIMRFMLIDLWMIRRITIAGKIDASYSTARQKNILKIFMNFRESLGYTKISNDHINNSSSIFNIFTDDVNNYLGYYEDEILSFKINMNLVRKYPDYYPQSYYNKNGAYRLL